MTTETSSAASRLGLGLAALGRPAYINSGRELDLGAARSADELRERTEQMLDLAYEKGIRYIDAARSYGRAEEFLAGWLTRRDDVQDVVVGSKWGYRYVGGWRPDADLHEVKDHSLTAFREQLSESRRLLGDRLAVYHVHSATLETGVLDDAALHRELADLRGSGVQVGVSVSGPRQPDVVRRALDVRVDGETLFTSVQCTWNLLEPSSGPALREAAAAGARVILKEVLANGRLTPHAEHVIPRAVAELARELSLPVDRIAVAAALAQPSAWRVLTGAVTPDQLASNLDAEAVDLPPGWQDALAQDAETPVEYWDRRSRRQWR